MDTLNAYGSSDSESDNDDDGRGINPSKQQADEAAIAPLRPSSTVRIPDRSLLQAAPQVSLIAGRQSSSSTGQGVSTALTTTTATASINSRKRPASGDSSLILMNNPTKAEMYQPIQGTQVMDPAAEKKLKPTGITEVNVAYDETNFQRQRTAFQRDGIAHAPTDDGNVMAVRTTLGYTRDRIQKMIEKEENRPKRPKDTSDTTPLVLGSDDEAEFGIWAPPSAEERHETTNALPLIQTGEQLAPEQLAEREYITERNRQKGIAEQQKDEESAYDRMVERKMAHLLPPVLNNKTSEPIEASTTFHGSEEYDYKGRSWMAPPAGLGSVIVDNIGGIDMTHHTCRVPKKCVHRFLGHNQGVHRIRLFPMTGHLLLSAGLDGKCKVWSVPQKQVMRTYIGHSAGVRDVQFNNNGTKFLSASFDRYIRLWDTESGSVLQTFTNRKVPYIVKFYPHDDNYFVVGCSDNKIVTYDTRTAEITQEYNHHLAPVNAIVFVGDTHGTTKMISASDDKKVLVWEWDIGVPVKYISDPSMHSMPCLTVHPSKQYFVGQSLDNTIVVFNLGGGRITIHKKKKYTGHIVSGYACDISFSPDGQYMMSGDGNGSLFIWDWKKHRIVQKYRAHSNGPAIGCVWHPLEPSTVFSCGWDGVIKMWQ